MFLDETAHEITQRAVSDFSLTISLWVESGQELERRPHQAPEGFPEVAGEANIVVGDDASWDPMKSDHLDEKQLGGVSDIRGLGTCYEMCHFAEAIEDHKDDI